MKFVRKDPLFLASFAVASILFAGSSYNAYLLDVAHPFEIFLFSVVFTIGPIEYFQRLPRPHARVSKLYSIALTCMTALVLAVSVALLLCSWHYDQHIPCQIGAALLPAAFPLGALADFFSIQYCLSKQYLKLSPMHEG